MRDDVWYVGADLGKSGGLCFMLDGKIIETQAMPVDSENDLDIKRLVEKLGIFTKATKCTIIFERITPLHLASAKSNWSLALQSGALEALCVALNLTYVAVPPKEWQKDMFAKLPPLRDKKGHSDTKGLALIAVKALFPDQILTDPLKPKAKVPHDGIVDSVLLAEWGRKNNK